MIRLDIKINKENPRSHHAAERYHPNPEPASKNNCQTLAMRYSVASLDFSVPMFATKIALTAIWISS